MTRIRTLFATALVLAASGLVHAQSVTPDKTSLNFYALAGGSAVSQTLNITTTGPTAGFGLLLTPQNSWLKVNPSQNSQTPAAITVTADPTGLAAAEYSGSIVVFVFDPVGTPSVTIPVKLIVGNIGVSPQSVPLVYQTGATAPQPVTLTLTGPSTSFNTSVSANIASWLQASPLSGTSPGSIVLSVNAGVVAGLTPGAYNGSVTITPTSGSILTPIVVPVSLTVTGTPPITVTPTTINLNYQIGGTNNTASQPVTLSTTGVQAVNYALQATVDPNPSGSVWISNPSSGVIPANGSTTAAIGYDTAKNLPASPNPYTGKVTVLTPGGTPPQQDVAVRLLVSNSPLLTVPGDTLAFNYQVGFPAPTGKQVTAISTQVAPNSPTGQMTLAISATTSGGNWLVVPASGVTGTPFNISVDVTGLAVGKYSGTVSVLGVGAGNPAQTIPVTLTIANDPQITATSGGCTLPFLTCKLLFPAQIGQTAPQAQTVRLASTGTPLNYSVTSTTASCGASWLALGGATTGSTEGSFTVSVNPAGIADGTQCNGTVTVAANTAGGAAAPDSPLAIPVTMYVSNNPLLSVTPVALSFSAQLNGSQTASQSITIAGTNAADPLNYSVTWTPTNGGNTWLIFGPMSGTTVAGQNVVTVLAQPGLLSPGVYTGNLTITAAATSGAAVADSPITIPVTFNVTSGALSVSASTLTFNQTAGGTVPDAQKINVTSTGQPFSWTASVSTGGTGNWLTIAPDNGTTPGMIAVAANADKLAPGEYNGTVTITAAASAFASGSPAIVKVRFVVAPGTLGATPASLTFVQAQGSPAPESQTIRVTGTPSPLGFTASATTAAGGNWLTVTPATGTTDGAVTVSVNGSTLAPNIYNGTVTIASPGANGSPKQVAVTLTILPSQTLTASPTTLDFSYVLTNPSPVSKTVQLTSTGGAAQFSATPSTSSGGNWLTVTPNSGSTPATLSISVNPAGLAAGNYTGKVSIASPSSITAVAASITVNFSVTQVAPPLIKAVRNNASYTLGAVSAGENVFIEGTNLGPDQLTHALLTSAGTIATTLADTQVTFDGIAAPIIYAFNSQTSVMVPYEVANRATVSMRVIFKGIQSDPVILNVAQAAPGIYTLNSQGFGPGAILNQNYDGNSASKPAAKSSVVQVFMTGEGLTIPTPQNGSLAPINGTGLYKPQLPVTATVGGIPANVQYYGSAPTLVYGIMQVNVEIPANAPSGAAELLIKVGTFSTQGGVTVAVE